MRFGGNTSCVSLRTSGGKLIILDCGTGARNLGNSLLGGPFGKGGGEASILLSHAHWDHIQGFPFFVPLFIPGNTFHIHGGAKSSSMLEGILEGQMAPHYFPVQTLKNMGASIEIVAVTEGEPFSVEGCRVTARTNPHGRSGALAFRVEDAGRVLVYASDAGYPRGGAPKTSIDLYAGADVLIHDSTYTPEDRERYARPRLLVGRRRRRRGRRRPGQAPRHVPLRPGLHGRRRRRARRARAPPARRRGRARHRGHGRRRGRDPRRLGDV